MSEFHLQDIYDSLSDEKRELQFGTGAEDALGKGFPRKRVVHAGIRGEIVPPQEAQQVWKSIMESPADRNEMQAAYIHIPFCKTKCLYCNFFQNATKQSVEDHYVDLLVAEIEAAAEQRRLKDGTIHAVFIGGGTPTSLTAENAARVLSVIQKKFPLSNDYELTFEGRIHDLVPEKIEAWLANGVNRISLGVQSFHTNVRMQQGRLENREEVFERIALLKSYQQCSVVIDLIFGLPGQTMEVWEQDLADLVASGIDGVDLYQLNVFDGSDLNKRIQAGKLPPAATTEEQAQMYAFAYDYLRKRGWRQLSMCHWSRTNRERSHYNALAKEGVPIFPFGSGAGGFLNGYAVMMHRAIQPYMMVGATGAKPIMGLIKQPVVQPFSNVAIRMLERGYIDLEEFKGMDARLAGLEWLCNLWEKHGLIEFNGVQYELTVAGKFWEVNLAQTTVECIQYLLTGENLLAVEKIAAQDSPAKQMMQQMMEKMQEKSEQAEDEEEKMEDVASGIGGMGGMNGMIEKDVMTGMPSREMMREMAKAMGITEMPSIEEMRKMAELMKSMKQQEDL